jgi:hypothetical protein
MGKTIYGLGGLRISSDLPLLELEACSGGAEEDCDVVICCAPILDEIISTTATFSAGIYSGTYDGRDVLLDFPSVGRFLLRAGKEILVELDSCSDPCEVRAHLLGVVFGALCHQRGIMPLHASAIEIGNTCVAFVGASGTGKSTLVASLGRRGHDIITDDECFLRLDADGAVHAWPGLGQVRLWEDARAVLGISDAGGTKEIQRRHKSLAAFPSPANRMRARPLRRVYELHRTMNEVVEVTPLRGAAAAEVLMQNIYPPEFAVPLGYQPRVFTACTAVARNVAVFRFSRPWRLTALNEGTELLEGHLSELTNELHADPAEI